MTPLAFKRILYIYLTAFVTLVYTKSVTFFEEEDKKGNYYSVEFEGLRCHNIPTFLNNKSSSVNTFQNCIVFYKDSDCQGKNQTISSTDYNYFNLRDFDFDDKISSFRQCDPDEKVCRGVDVKMDYSLAPDLKDVALKMKQTIEEWYPRICRSIWTPFLLEYQLEYRKILLSLDGHKDLVAKAEGNSIHANPTYFRSHPDDMGTIVHELGHILQRYLSKRTCPKWLVEGIADYPRRYIYQQDKPEETSGQDEKRKYTELVNWIDERWPNTIYRINEACRDGTFDDGLLERITGKKMSKLWEEMKRDC